MPDQEDVAHQVTPDLPVTTRSLTTEQLEAVIRRALELQAGSSARSDDGVSEVDVVRIGQELGLEPATVRRAMAEVRSRPDEEHGALVRIAGEATVRASRVLQRPAASVAPQLDHYLRAAELMVAQRRFADRTRYVRDASLVAGITRIARGFSRSHQPLNMQKLDVTVSAIDATSCLLEVSVDLGGTRAGIVGGVLGSSSAVAAGWAATVWATAIFDPLMLLGIPLVAGSWFGMRAIYATVRKSIQEKLESLLDRVEHNDLTS